MKYYAVTEDPNELLHYGRLGMKWGKHIFGDDRPKSAGYKRALGKLRSSTKKTSTQKLIAKRQKQQERFNRAVQKTQDRIAVTENLHNLDQMRAYSRQADRQYKAERKAARLAEKQDRKYARNDRKMQKFTQLAREGRLRYGKLSDDQVEQVRSRLALEQTARNLDGREKPKFRVRLKEAWQEGILSGVAQGTAAGMKEVAVAKVQNRLRNKRILDRENRNDAKRQKEATRIKNKKSAKEIRQEVKQEAYEAAARSGENVWDRLDRGMIGRHMTTTRAARNLQLYKEREANRNFENERRRNFEDERAKSWNKYLTDNGLTEKTVADSYRKKLSDQKSNAIANLDFSKADALDRKIKDFKKVSKDPKALREEILGIDAASERAKEKAAYEEFKKKESDKLEAEALAQQVKEEKEKHQQEINEYNDARKRNREKDELYDRDLNNWYREYMLSKGTTLAKKPDANDKKYQHEQLPNHPGKFNPSSITLTSDKVSQIRSSLPSWEEYRRFQRIGLPSPYGGNKNGGGGRKKN